MWPSLPSRAIYTTSTKKGFATIFDGSLNSGCRHLVEGKLGNPRDLEVPSGRLEQRHLWPGAFDTAPDSVLDQGARPA
jgi:hypothetical protein